MATKVTVPYPHQPDDLQAIHLAITTAARPSPGSWVPALRDIVDGKRVVWARFPGSGRRVSVWVKDSDGERAVTSATA